MRGAGAPNGAPGHTMPLAPPCRLSFPTLPPASLTAFGARLGDGRAALGCAPPIAQGGAPMGDGRSIVIWIPAPEDWSGCEHAAWSIFDLADREVSSGVTVGAPGATLYDVLSATTAAVRRHLVGYRS